jgi:hypothetical protein
MAPGFYQVGAQSGRSHSNEDGSIPLCFWEFALVSITLHDHSDAAVRRAGPEKECDPRPKTEFCGPDDLQRCQPGQVFDLELQFLPYRPSGSGILTASSSLPSTSNFFVDFFALL